MTQQKKAMLMSAMAVSKRLTSPVTKTQNLVEGVMMMMTKTLPMDAMYLIEVNVRKSLLDPQRMSVESRDIVLPLPRNLQKHQRKCTTTVTGTVGLPLSVKNI